MVKTSLMHLSVGFLAVGLASTGFAATHTVDNLIGVDDGVSPFATIGAAVTAATAGDVIEIVPTGANYDGQILIGKSLTLKSSSTSAKPVLTTTASPGTTRATLRGGTQKAVITVGAANVTIDGLHIRSTQSGTDSTRVSGIIAQDNFGAGFTTSFDNLIISGCTFDTFGTGRSTWEHYGVLAASTTATIADKVTVRNNEFLAGNTVAAASIADAQGYKGLRTHMAKSMRFAMCVRRPL